MAQPPTPSDAFLREVDDELRRDQLTSAWRRWGRIGVGVVLAGLLLFGGWLYWNARSERLAGEHGEQLQSAYDQLAANQTAEADATLARLTGESEDGIRALALLAQADRLLAQGDAKGAAAKFATVAADTSLGQPFRDMALLRQTVAEYDALPPQTVIERLRPLATPDNPWFAAAGEMTGIAYLRQNRRDLAGKLFGQIARTEDAPESTRQRAVQMASAMGVDAGASAAPGAGPNAGVTP